MSPACGLPSQGFFGSSPRRSRPSRSDPLPVAEGGRGRSRPRQARFAPPGRTGRRRAVAGRAELLSEPGAVAPSSRLARIRQRPASSVACHLADRHHPGCPTPRCRASPTLMPRWRRSRSTASSSDRWSAPAPRSARRPSGSSWLRRRRVGVAVSIPARRLPTISPTAAGNTRVGGFVDFVDGGTTRTTTTATARTSPGYSRATAWTQAAPGGIAPGAPSMVLKVLDAGGTGPD